MEQNWISAHANRVSLSGSWSYKSQNNINESDHGDTVPQEAKMNPETDTADREGGLPIQEDSVKDEATSMMVDGYLPLIRLGQAAYRYGSTALALERFMESTAKKVLGCESILVRASKSELFCNFGPGTLTMVEINDGLDLNKLALFSQTAGAVVKGRCSILDAVDKLNEIDNMENPWNSLACCFGYLGVGSGLPVLLGGNWWDVVFGLVASVPAYGLSAFLGRSQSLSKFIPLSTSFVATLIAAGAKYAFSDLNEVIVVISAIAIPLPGYAITLGSAELASEHVLAGTARLISGILVLLWLIAGAWLGSSLVHGLAGESDSTTGESVPDVWQVLFAPIVFFALAVTFQNSYRDTPWAMINQAVGYATTFLARLPNVSNNLSTFLATFVMTVTANLWARWKDRPASIVLIPSVVVMVSGSSGFRGLVYLFSPDGTDEEGYEQIGNMFEVAVMIIAGILAADMIVPSNTTL